MKSTRVSRLFVAGVFLAMVVITLVAFTSNSVSRHFAEAPTRGDLVALDLVRNTFRTMGSLHVRGVADVRTESLAGVVQSGRGTFEHWELGNKYRIESTVDPSVRSLHSGTTMTYDGSQYAYYDSVSDIVAYAVLDRRNNPTSLPNPLFFMIDFLGRGNEDGCFNCFLRLADLNDEPRWLEALGSAKFGPSGFIDVVREVPGGHRFHHRVGISDDRRITTVERLDETTGESSLFEFSEHDSNGLPRVVTLTAHDTKRGTLKIRFEIEVLEPAAGADEKVFRFDSSQVSTVWDDDARAFLRTR